MNKCLVKIKMVKVTILKLCCDPMYTCNDTKEVQIDQGNSFPWNFSKNSLNGEALYLSL